MLRADVLQWETLRLPTPQSKAATLFNQYRKHFPEHESTETHLAWGRKYTQTHGEEWDSVTFLALWLIFGPLQSSFSIKYSRFYNTEARGGKYITYNQWQTTVKRWLKHVKYGGRVYCHTLAFWKNLHFKSSAAVGLWRGERALDVDIFRQIHISRHSTIRTFSSFFVLSSCSNIYLTWPHFHWPLYQIRSMHMHA